VDFLNRGSHGSELRDERPRAFLSILRLVTKSGAALYLSGSGRASDVVEALR
jgi:hypothetical protein